MAADRVAEAMYRDVYDAVKSLEDLLHHRGLSVADEEPRRGAAAGLGGLGGRGGRGGLGREAADPPPTAASRIVSGPSPTPAENLSKLYAQNASNSSLNSYSYLDDLHESELQLRRKKAFIERVIEQHENLSEQKRRNDISQLCEKLQDADVASKPHQKSSRIKTNGSLPRERYDSTPSATSPAKGSSSSDDIPRLSGLSASSSPRSPECRVEAPVGVGGPVLAEGSPSSAPGSPRRGIKTVLSSKECFSFPQEITDEVVGKHLGLPEEYKKRTGTAKGRSHAPVTSTPREGGGSGGQAYSRTLPNPRRDKFIFPLEYGADRAAAAAAAGGSSGTPPMSEKAMTLSLELEFVQKERLKIMSGVTVLKARLAELEAQREEAEREAAMEQAFIRAELRSKADKMQAQTARIRSLQERADRCQREIDSWQENRNKQQCVFSRSVEAAELELERLRADLDRCRDADAARELRDRIHQQADVVDSEKKLYEDLEFKYLEEESVWLARKEELNKELSDALNKFEEYVGQVSQLESWVTAGSQGGVGGQQEGGLAEQKQAYSKRLQEGQLQLDLLDSRIEELVRQGAGNLGCDANGANGDVFQADLKNALSTSDLDSTASEPFTSFNGLSSLESSFCSYQLNLPMGAEAGMASPPPDDAHDQGDDRVPASATSPEPTYAAAGSTREPDGGVAAGEAVPVASQPWPRPAAGGGQRDLQPGLGHGLSPGLEDGVDGDRDHDLGAEAQALRPAPRATRRPGNVIQAQGVQKLVQRQARQQRQQRPLTRYLPVRGGDLDLRQHVETAGHAVDLCGHVSVDATSCRGPLLKLSARFGSWQKRWFLFDRSDRLLSYCKGRRSSRPRGGIRFQSIAEVYVDHMSGHKHAQPNCVFVVKTTERAYRLMAPSPEAMRIWVDVIFTGAEAYQEFD